jgi:hypothetical protein
MALTEAQMKQLAEVVVDRILASDKFPAPKDAADYTPTGKGSTWSGRTVFNRLLSDLSFCRTSLAAIRKKLDA